MPRIIRHDGLVWVDSLTEREKKRLTLVGPGKSTFAMGEKSPLKLYVEDGAIFGVPRWFAEKAWPDAMENHWGLVPDKRVSETMPEPLSWDVLWREGQEAAYKSALKAVQKGGCVLVAPPGSGKTIIGTGVIAALGERTLVIVHKEFLARQWEAAVRMLMGITAGRIQQDTIEIKPVTIATVQSIAGHRDYTDALQSFGFLVVDECIDGDSGIWTPNGYKRMKDIKVGDNVTTPYGVKQVTEVWKKTKVAKRYMTPLGEIIASPDHLVPTPLRWGKGNLLVGFVEIDKAKRLFAPIGGGPLYPKVSEGRRTRFDYLHDTCHTIHITGSEDVGERELYDLSLADLDYPRQLFVANGFLVHNCHRMGAPQWSTVPAKIPARYRLGLSATPNRPDGMGDAFIYHLGPIVKTKLQEQMKPRVCLVPFDPDWEPKRYIQVWDGKFGLSRAKSSLAKNQRRTAVIARVVGGLLEDDHKVMILSDRLAHLKDLEEKIKADDVGWYTGGMKQDALDESAKRQLILATFQMAQEGLDIPDLTAVVLATPRGSVEQAIGRALRIMEGKRQPVVIDIVDKNDYLLMLANKRRRMYDSKGYDVEVIEWATRKHTTHGIMQSIERA